MQEANDAVVVFRSADTDRNTQADLVAERLRAAGIDAAVPEEDDPGVVVGTSEVRVAASDKVRAEELIASLPAHLEGDTSSDLDMVSVFSAEGASAEMEALAVKGILESGGIEAIVVGSASLPNLPFEVHVPREDAESALQAIEAAQAAGPSEPEAGFQASGS